MVQWSTRQDWVDETGWFADKVCVCDMSGIYKNGYDWRSMNEYKVPPICVHCNKWANRLMTCCMCHEYYYQFFMHPRMGHHMKPVRGWYCWNCLEKYMPPVAEPGATKRTQCPPPALVLPPGYEIYKPEPIQWG